MQNNLEIIKNETIKYNSAILVKTKELSEVYHYSRSFTTDIDYKLITVKLNIPLVGINEKKNYSRILLYLDNDMICDGSIWSHVEWELKPIYLEGIGVNIKKGDHSVKLMCSVTGEKLNIPYFDTSCALNTIKPPLSSKLIIIGQN